MFNTLTPNLPVAAIPLPPFLTMPPLKTTESGRSALFSVASGQPLTIPSFRQFIEALQAYKNNRENGEEIDNPGPFPSAGFEQLSIVNCVNKPAGQQGEPYYPDALGQYWYLITLANGQVLNFRVTRDNIRGYPDINNPHRYWIIIHGPNDVKIEGFSIEFDNISNGYSWHYVKYTQCGPIKNWMEEKDRNYRGRKFSFQIPFTLPLPNALIMPEIPPEYLCHITRKIMLRIPVYSNTAKPTGGLSVKPYQSVKLFCSFSEILPLTPA